MSARGFWSLEEVADELIERRLADLLQSGGRTEARVLAHLAEMDERRLHLRAGFGSLFEYCLKRLRMSEDEACRRIGAARLARRFPAIFALIDQRKLHLTGACLLRHYLTPENHRELLAEACGKTRRQLEELLATRFPQPDVPSFIRHLRSPLESRRFERVEQRSTETFRLQLNASKSFKDKLERSLDLWSHAVPNRDMAKVLERGLDLLLEKGERERFGKGARATKHARAQEVRSKAGVVLPDARSPAVASVDAHDCSGAIAVRITRAGAGKAPGRVTPTPPAIAGRRASIPRATRAEVSARDGESCSFVGENGHRCGARAFLQLHHEQAWARGGADTATNLTWLCAAHNRLLAEQAFGEEHVAGAIGRRSA
jgi:hypothetical protein